MEGILGKKLGMTQIFAEDGDGGPGDGDPGRALPGRAARRPPRPTATTRCSSAWSRSRRRSTSTKPQAGHFKKAGVPPMRRLAEFQLDAGRGRSRPATRSRPRSSQADDYVDVIGTSKGKGFQGVDQAPRLPRRPRHATARCSTAPRARSAPRPFPSRVYPGHARHRPDGRRAGDGQEPAGRARSTPRRT